MAWSEPEGPRTVPSSHLERLLRRDRIVTLVGLVALSLLAWAYLLSGAAMAANISDMARLVLFPHRLAESATMAGMQQATMGSMTGMPMEPVTMGWLPSTWVAVAAMWWVMMIAMMTPSAAPTILLYGTVYRRAQVQGAAARIAPTGAFAAGYLFVWFGFSLAATALQWAFTNAGLLAGMTMTSRSAYLSAAVLFAAGLYQLSPFKDVCLRQCRDPVSFLTRRWRPGPAGALRLGVLHGAYCVGCCWLLMALLFVGGVMNLIWIAVLASLVLVEKLIPAGRRVGLAAGVVLCLWALATVLV